MDFKIKVKECDSVLKITAGVHKMPWGDCLVSQEGDALCGFHFWDGEEDVMEALRNLWPGSEICYNEKDTSHWVEFAIKLLEGGKAGNRELLLIGTSFQVRIWEVLLGIKAGKVCSYQDIATKIGRPRAVRAVGTAVGKNPISLVVPCHRVIRQDGGLGGYAWGLERKQALLDYEKAICC